MRTWNVGDRAIFVYAKNAKNQRYVGSEVEVVGLDYLPRISIRIPGSVTGDKWKDVWGATKDQLKPIDDGNELGSWEAIEKATGWTVKERV